MTEQGGSVPSFYTTRYRIERAASIFYKEDKIVGKLRDEDEAHLQVIIAGHY